MNAHTLATEFIRIFAADQAAFPAADINLRAEQSTEELPRDASGPDQYRPHTLVFEVTTTPLDVGGTLLRYALNLAIETKPDEDADAHAALVEKVRRKFFGATAAGLGAAREAMTAAMAAGGIFTLRNYDAGADPIDPSTENTKLRTVFPVRGVAVLV